ncbi:MAG: 3-methyladenine DNA glycosylase, partial [Kiritimatiellia bacterium]
SGLYRAKMEPWVSRRRARRSRGEKHPFEDFLWEYYSLRGGRLLQWSAGAGVLLEEATAEEFPDKEGYRQEQGGRWLDAAAWRVRRTSGVEWILHLLKQTRDRPPSFGCLGLHEWAMVYEEKDVRHPQLPLRLGQEGTRALVESMPMQCTHFDAFRFFSESARPLNQIPLTAEGRPQQEQPGCLHANMDLFKWCMKLQPLVPSTLVEDCFDLAWRAREIDMRASAYDVSSMGYPPIPIETPSGRREYVQFQKEIASAAAPLRNRLIAVLEQAMKSGE